MATELTRDNLVKTTRPELRENIMQNKANTSDNGLRNAEEKFIKEVAEEVEKDNQDIGYQLLIKQAPTDNKGAFWFELALALSELPSNKSLDVRENGRLRVSLEILDEMLKSNERFPQIGSTKIIVLKYLAHSHWATSNALRTTTNQQEIKLEREKSKAYARGLLSTTEQAVEKFPDGKWFSFEREEALEDFSEWDDSVKD